VKDETGIAFEHYLVCDVVISAPSVHQRMCANPKADDAHIPDRGLHDGIDLITIDQRSTVAIACTFSPLVL